MKEKKSTIMTNITLDQREDQKLKVEAARAGQSKRDMATRITQEWLQERHLRETITAVAQQIAPLPGRVKYFEALDSLLDNCIKLVEYSVRETSAQIFNKSFDSNTIEAAREEIISSITTLREVVDFPEIDPARLAFAVISAYSARSNIYA